MENLSFEESLEKLEEIVRKTTCFSEKSVRAARQNGRDVYINNNDVIIIGKTARKMNAFRRRRAISFGAPTFPDKRRRTTTVERPPKSPVSPNFPFSENENESTRAQPPMDRRPSKRRSRKNRRVASKIER